METNPSSFFIICCFLLFLVIHSIPQCLASRKLLDLFPYGNYLPGTPPQVPPPTPGNKVVYRSETVNGTHAQVVCVNGKPRSKAGTVNGNGRPVIKGTSHEGSQNGVITGKNGKPTIVASNTTHSQTSIINGIDGKPQFEVHKYDNGTSTVFVLGADGKPLYQINALPPPPSTTSGGLAGGYSYTPPPMSKETNEGEETCSP